MINADDFYGSDAFIKAYDFLNKIDINSVNKGDYTKMVDADILK